MNLTRACSVLLTVLVASSGPVRAQDSQPVKRDLRFEVSSETHAFRRGMVTNAVPPTHVAVIELPKPVAWLGKTNSHNLVHGIFNTPAGKTASPEQKQYPGRVDFLNMDSPGRPYAGPVSRVEIWAATSDDARKTAEAFLQVTDEIAARSRAEIEDSLKRSREWVAAAEKDLPEIEPRLKAARAEREAIEKVIAYSGAEDATRDILELDKALRSVGIDLTVIKAKQGAIGTLLSSPPTRGTTKEPIQQMRAAQDIEMAGALARKSALEAERKKAVHYRDLVWQIEKDSKRLDELTKFYRVEDGKGLTSIALKQRQIAELERELAETQPLTVAGDKITIYPVARQGSDSRPAPLAPMPRPPMPAPRQN